MNPVKDQKAGVVGHPAQPLRSLFFAPANPLIPSCALPSRRAEENAGQWPSPGTANPILQVLAHPAAIAQIMVTGYAGFQLGAPSMPPKLAQLLNPQG